MLKVSYKMIFIRKGFMNIKLLNIICFSLLVNTSYSADAIYKSFSTFGDVCIPSININTTNNNARRSNLEMIIWRTVGPIQAILM